MARRKPKPPAKPRATLAETSREAVCIVRCSTLKQGDGTSPEVQEKGMVEYALRNGMKPTVVRVFESGKDAAARPQYQAALVEARRKGNLIFWVGDRSGRNLTDHEELEREVRAGKFRVHIASENRVFKETTPDTDWFAADVNKVTHKQFSRDLRRRALEGMKARADAGEYPSKPPLGYINAPRTGVDGEAIRRGTRIQKLPWCDPLLLRMLDLRLGGASYKAIAAAVLKEGLVPAHKRGPFEQAAAATKVELLLKNPFYMGRFEWNGDEYAGTHEPVFSAAQWEQLQGTFHGKPAPLRIVKRDAALAGFMKCAECGCSITYDPKKKPSGVVYDYYRCANGKKQHNKLVYVKEADILAGFASAAEAIAIDMAIAEELLEILNRSNAEVRTQRKRDAERFRRELSALELKEDQLTELLLAGTLDEPAFKKQLHRIREQRTDFAQKLEAASERLDDAHMETVRSTLELAKRAKIQWVERSALEKRRFLELVLSNPQLDGESVRYELRKPFALLAEMNGSSSWRTRHDSNMRPSDS